MTKVFNLKINIAELEDAFRDMNTALQKANVGTLNIVGRKVNKEIATDIKQNYNIKARSLKIGKTVRLIRADVRRRIPFFTISILKKGRGLFLYSPIQTKIGISVKIKKTRKKVKGSYFIIARKNKQKFVVRKDKKGGTVERVSRTGRRYTAPRSEFLFGPSIASLYRRRKALKVVHRIIEKEYKKMLDVQFNRQFEKRR